MFTLEQVDAIHDRAGNADTLVAYLQALQGIGVERSESFVADGHTVYLGEGGYAVTSPAAHEVVTVAEVSDRARFLGELELHRRGETSYVEMSKGLADSGVEKWVFDTGALTIAYFDKAGNVLLAEAVE